MRGIRVPELNDISKGGSLYRSGFAIWHSAPAIFHILMGGLLRLNSRGLMQRSVEISK
jgi:hypothetical protein